MGIGRVYFPRPSFLPSDRVVLICFHVNNSPKTARREIDRRSPRKLPLRRIWLNVLFIRVSRNLFDQETCSAAQCRDRLTHAKAPPRKLNEPRTTARQGNKKHSKHRRRYPRVLPISRYYGNRRDPRVSQFWRNFLRAESFNLLAAFGPPFWTEIFSSILCRVIRLLRWLYRVL